MNAESKTLVIINVSPCASHSNQTIGSLNFGSIKATIDGTVERTKWSYNSALMIRVDSRMRERAANVRCVASNRSSSQFVITPSR